VHLVGFILRIYHVARPSECPILVNPFLHEIRYTAYSKVHSLHLPTVCCLLNFFFLCISPSLANRFCSAKLWFSRHKNNPSLLFNYQPVKLLCTKNKRKGERRLVFFKYDSKLHIAIISKSRAVIIKLTNKTNFRAIQSCITIILTPCSVTPVPKQPCPPAASAKRHYRSVQGVTFLRVSHRGVLPA